MRKPLLRYITCHRGDAIGDAVVRRAAGERISTGPLRGCFRVKGEKGMNVFKVGRGYMLEFRLVIRVTP